MEKRTRRKFSADFKAKVVIESLRERSTIEELARKYELHPNQISIWKKEFMANAALAFSADADKSEEKEKQEANIERLYAKIGQQKVELDFLKKSLDRLG